MKLLPVIAHTTLIYILYQEKFPQPLKCLKSQCRADNKGRAASKPIDHSRLKIYYSLCMYRRPKFLEVLHEIREEMSREADYDMDLFAEMVRNEKGKRQKEKGKNIKDDEQLTADHRPLTTVYGNRF